MEDYKKLLEKSERKIYERIQTLEGNFAKLKGTLAIYTENFRKIVIEHAIHVIRNYPIHDAKKILERTFRLSTEDVDDIIGAIKRCNPPCPNVVDLLSSKEVKEKINAKAIEELNAMLSFHMEALMKKKIKEELPY